MRVRFISALFFLAAIPTLALAQRGGGHGASPRNDKYKETNDLPKYPAAAELQKYNPVMYLIDQKKKLSLTDSQVTALRPLQGMIFERNADLVARYDSVQRIYKPENANDASNPKADSIRTRALGQTAIMNSVLDSLMDRRQNDDLDALSLIADDKQKKKAAELLDKQDASFAKLMPGGSSRSGRRRSN